MLSISALYTVLADVIYGNSLDDSDCLHFLCMPYIYFKRTHYCMWDIDCRRPILSCTLQPASAIVRPWLTAWSTTVALISSDIHLCPWPFLPLPLFCLFTLPPCILTPLLPLVCWHWSFSRCSSIVRICNSCIVLCLYILYIYIYIYI